MWPKRYKDYPPDDPLIQNPVYPDAGIVGCEMHERNGWDTACHQKPPQKQRKSWMQRFKNVFRKR
jgi:hypothetical protein